MRAWCELNRCCWSGNDLMVFLHLWCSFMAGRSSGLGHQLLEHNQINFELPKVIIVLGKFILHKLVCISIITIYHYMIPKVFQFVLFFLLFCLVNGFYVDVSTSIYDRCDNIHIWNNCTNLLHWLNLHDFTSTNIHTKYIWIFKDEP